MSSNVAGQAMLPTTATCCRMLTRLSDRRKNGDAHEKKAKRATRTTISAAVSGTERPLPPATAGGIGIDGAAGIAGAASAVAGADAGGTGGSWSLVTSLILLKLAAGAPRSLRLRSARSPLVP